jgi:hypothetical protein
MIAGKFRTSGCAVLSQAFLNILRRSDVERAVVAAKDIDEKKAGDWQGWIFRGEMCKIVCAGKCVEI